MSRAAAIGFAAIIFGAGAVVGFLLAGPRQLVSREDNSALLAGIATEAKAGNARLTPTTPPYLTATPTNTPRPATSTPMPTYGPEASPGWYVVPAHTMTPVEAMTVEAILPPCVTVTPRPYADQPCEVAE